MAEDNDTTKTLTINLYILKREDTVYAGEWASCVVASRTETNARQMANEAAKAEGYVWTDGHLTTCQKIGVADDGIAGVVLHSTENEE